MFFGKFRELLVNGSLREKELSARLAGAESIDGNTNVATDSLVWL